jgi:hypothetical protein
MALVCSQPWLKALFGVVVGEMSIEEARSMQML